MRRFSTFLVCFGLFTALAAFGSKASAPSAGRVTVAAVGSPIRFTPAWQAEVLAVSTATTSTSAPAPPPPPPPSTTTSTTAAPPRAFPPEVSRSKPPRPVTTTTTMTAAPAPAGCMRHGAKSYGEMQSCWGELVARYPWPAGKVFSVMYCESKGDPWARNRSGATGLMQVMGGPTDPSSNIATAYRMYSQRGWQPWVCH